MFHSTMYAIATILLANVTRSFTRTDIDCPGDTVTYECRVQSNSEMVQLMWLVTFPGQKAITMFYINDSYVNITSNLGMNISTTLTQYTVDESIESKITITVLRNVSMNGTLVECRSEDLGRETEILYVNSLGIVTY